MNDRVEACLAAGSALHPFMARFTAAIGGSPDSFADFVRQSQARFEGSLLQSLRSRHATAEIPKITHRIWVTSGEQPAMPPDSYMANYLKANQALPQDMLHMFWTNSAAVAEHVQRHAAQAHCVNLCTVGIGMVSEDPMFTKVLALLTHRKFVLAADVLKFVILNRFGGIYADMGITFDQQIVDLARISDYAFVVSDNVFLQSSFFACAPGADLCRMFLAVMNHPAAFLPEFALLGQTPCALDEVHVFAGFGLTACAMLFLPESARALMVPANSPNLTWESQRSWYGHEAKHGNAIVDQTPPSVFTEAMFSEAAQVWQDCVTLFGTAPLLRAQLRALIVTAPYFAEHPTPFCRRFFFQGSDKALSWHNYAYIYNYLLGTRVGRVRRILEIGIDTNRLDVPSTIGATDVPGASLRGWRECFPDATVVGAAGDVRILFQDEGIETYWVDQTRADAVARLFDLSGGPPFDVIIDDGLHSFAANQTLLAGAYPHLSADGVYIVEDVANHDVAAWMAFLESAHIVAAVLSIPNANNQSDNRLVIIPGGQNLPRGQ